MKERYGTVYKGSQKLIDEQTGEVIEVDKLYRKQTSGNFVKAFTKLPDVCLRYSLSTSITSPVCSSMSF